MNYYFSDITKIGKDFTGKKDIGIITNEQAVLESVSNILNTEPGDRVMNPLFGCNIRQYLFDPLDPITANFIRREIEEALRQQESRIENIKIDIQIDEDNQSYIINVVFNMKVLNTQGNITFELNKIR